MANEENLFTRPSLDEFPVPTYDEWKAAALFLPPVKMFIVKVLRSASGYKPSFSSVMQYTARAVFLVYNIPLKRAVPNGFLFFSRLRAKDGKNESGLFRSGTELQNTSVLPPKKNSIRFEVLRRLFINFNDFDGRAVKKCGKYRIYAVQLPFLMHNTKKNGDV